MNMDFPFHLDSRGRTATAGADEHIRDLIEQFLFTSAGERVNRPDFGSGLLQMIFAPNRSDVATALQFTIQAGLNRWLGDLIEVHKLEVLNQEATLYVTVEYAVRQSGEQRIATFTRENVL